MNCVTFLGICECLHFYVYDKCWGNISVTHISFTEGGNGDVMSVTEKLGSRSKRPIYFECKLNEPMHIDMR